jgi:hypothetical protein
MGGAAAGAGADTFGRGGAGEGPQQFVDAVVAARSLFEQARADQAVQHAGAADGGLVAGVGRGSLG